MPKKVSKGIKSAERSSKKPFGIDWVDNQNIDRQLAKIEKEAKKAPSMPR